MGVAVLRQRPVTGRSGDKNVVTQTLKLVRQVENMTGNAARVGQVVRANKENSQGGGSLSLCDALVPESVPNVVPLCTTNTRRGQEPVYSTGSCG